MFLDHNFLPILYLIIIFPSIEQVFIKKLPSFYKTLVTILTLQKLPYESYLASNLRNCNITFKYRTLNNLYSVILYSLTKLVFNRVLGTQTLHRTALCNIQIAYLSFGLPYFRFIYIYDVLLRPLKILYAEFVVYKT